jgi:hypothetical protein
MTKKAIIQLLQSNHNEYIVFIDKLTQAQFIKVVNNKWTAGQQTEHLCKTTKPLLLPFMLPTWLLKLKFGVANRPSKTYEALVEKYNIKLLTAAAAPSKFTPQTVSFEMKEKLLANLKKNVRILCKLIATKSENDLDRCILPHPLLGKITLREMLYFTVHHVHFHLQSVQKIVA